MALTLDEAFGRLRTAHAEDRLAHAYLITGPPGSGIREFAEKLAALLLGVDSAPFDHCDAHVLEAESKSRRIKIEAVRELARALQLRSFCGGRKVGVVFDAERLVEAAANAFLKTLEEPAAGAHLLLVSSQPDQLLDTVISRCVEIPLRVSALPPVNPREQALLEMVATVGGTTDLAGAFGLVQHFAGLSTEAREGIQEQIERDLKREEAAYKQVGDTRGLEEREEYYKALGEARYRAERAGLVTVLEQWFADALRQHYGATALDLPIFAPATRALADRIPTHELLQRAAALEGLRENFNRNVQEQLALECAFLRAFAGV